VSALQELLERMRSSDREHFAHADVAFHVKIAELAGNVVLKDMLASIGSTIHGWVGRNIRAAGTTKIAYKGHVPIYEAIAAATRRRPG
jgi:GntR family transcriptional regulator, transcriptional repressor for pyruvate dehydrogenase complex